MVYFRRDMWAQGGQISVTYILQLVYQQVVIAALLHLNVLVSFLGILFPETMK